jgi:hypothetical protein
LIYFLQTKTDKKVKEAVDRIDDTVNRMDEVTKRQYNIIKEEEERRKKIIKYATDHIIDYLELTKTSYTNLKKYSTEFINHKSPENRSRIIEICDREGPNIQNYVIPYIADKVRLTTGYVNNVWLTYKFLDAYILGSLGNIFMAIKLDLRYVDNDD